MYTNYKLTDKPLGELTIIQYKAIMIIAQQITEWKNKHKPMVVI
jgi:hypothetical protein